MAQSYFPRRVVPWENKRNRSDGTQGDIVDIGDIVDAEDINQAFAEIQAIEDKVIEHIDLLISNRQDRIRLGKLEGIQNEMQDWLENLEQSGGVQGTKGETGEPGPKGDTGRDGYTPVKGKDYFDGEVGSQGARGEKGDAPVISFRMNHKGELLYTIN